MTPNILQADMEVIYFKDFQRLAGSLTEIDPFALMREVNDDVSRSIGRALDFANSGSIGELTHPMKNSFLFVGNELINHKVDIDMRTAMSYTHQLQAVGLEYLNHLSTTPLWVTHHPTFVSARYNAVQPDDLEVLIRYDLQRPQLDGMNLSMKEVNEIKPTLFYCAKQLLGAAVEATKG